MGGLRILLASCGRLETRACLVVLAYGLAGCAWSPVEPYAGQGPRLQTLYVIASGWHTEVGVSAQTLAGPLVSLRTTSPEARFFVFGWGQRDYYMAQNPGLGEMIEAVFPASAVMLVIPLNKSPPEFFAGSSVFAIRISQEGLDRLSQFLWDYLEKGPQNLPRQVGDGPYPGSTFYASSGTYSLGNTCNTWTAEALGIGGLPVSAAGVVFADQVVAQARRLAERQE
jgi:uncharacterized protein (TIGR02117 family)